MNAKMSKIAFAVLSITFAASGQEKKLNTASIDDLTGLKGKLNEQENVYKVSSPRTDLNISVDQWEMPPLMGLTSWPYFRPGMKGEAMFMGARVLMQDGVSPVLSASVETGLQV